MDDSDVVDIMMIGDIFRLLVPDAKCKKILGVGDQSGQNCHQHLKVVTNTFRPPTSVTNIDVTHILYLCTNGQAFKVGIMKYKRAIGL